MRDLVRRFVRYPAEALGAVLAFGLFALLPTDAASAVGGWLGRTIGPRLPVTRRALDNIALAMPETTPEERGQIVCGMWDNLGRVMAEYPHIGRIARDTGSGCRLEIAGEDNLESLRAPGTACVMFSGHFANWELFPLGSVAAGVPTALFYREPNNPLVSLLIGMMRGRPSGMLLPKGRVGARMAIKALARGDRVGMLVDQKMNDGIAAPFFGLEAMSPPAAAQLAIRFDCAIVPARLERLGGCRFRLTFLPPLDPVRTGDRSGDAQVTMARVNEMLEGWIRERPEQWLWLHRRWPDEARRVRQEAATSA